MSEPTSSEPEDFHPVDPSAFTTTDERVINMKGINYYRSCDAFVRKLPDGGSTYCIRQMNHEDNNHIDWSGHCTNPLIYIGEEETLAPSEFDFPTIDGGVKLVPTDSYSDDVEFANPEFTVTLSVGCKTRAEVDRVLDLLQRQLNRVAIEAHSYASLSFYANTEEDQDGVR